MGKVEGSMGTWILVFVKGTGPTKSHREKMVVTSPVLFSKAAELDWGSVARVG